MKKIITKGLSLILSTIIMFSVVPIVKAAEEDTPTIDSGETNFVIEDSSLGAIINDTIEEQETDSSEYYIKYMEVYDNVAVVDLFCIQSCTLVVAVFTEEGKMVGSGTINVEPNITGDINTEYVDLTVDSMPEHFVAKAFLLDDNNAALCKEYTCKLYTKEYQEFLSKTIYDFPDNTVVNLDEETDNNFAVLADGAISVDSDENKNDLVSYDEKTGSYVFENADDVLNSVEIGDTLYIDTNEDDCIVIKVKEIEVNGKKTVITAESDIEISDLFTYIKIDASAQADADGIDTSEMDEGVEYLGSYEVSEPATTYSSRAIDESVKTAFPFELKKTFKTSDGTIVSVKGGAEISIEGHLKFDFDEKNMILDILYETSVGLTLNASVSLEVKNTIRLDLPRFPIPICAGVTIYGSPKIVFSGKAVVEVENAKYFYKVGFSYDTANGKKNINEKNTDWEPKFESKMELTIGLEFKLSGELIGALELSVDFTAGVKLVINILAMNDYNDVGEKHMCSPCIDGDIDFYFSVKAGVALGLPFGVKFELLEVTFANITMDLFDFYYSLGDKGIGFGFGECKNYVNEHKSHTHTLTGWQTTVYPTCTKTGTRIKKCTSCGVVVNKETISKTGHSTGSWITTLEPTCVKDGVRIKKCSACKAVVSKEYIAKSGHKEGAWETTKVSTCIEKGTRIKKCTVCKAVLKSEELPFSDHASLIWSFTADAETGESLGTLNCSLCGEIFETRSGILTFTLSDNGKSYILSDCVNSIEGEIVIPSSYNSKPVTNIDYRAFSDCTSLTGIIISDGITSVGNYAFSDCTSLTSITIPNSVTGISYRAFYNCTSLANITIPDSVTGIGGYAFEYCTNLTSITIPDSVTIIDDCAFSNCSSLTDIIIPDSVTSIGAYAFRDCRSLTNITIPDSVTSIGVYAFSYCNSLTGITISDSVTIIDDYAFSNCNSLTSVTIPDSVTNIGKDAFSYCNRLTSITIPDSVTSVGSWAFYACSLADVYYYGTEERWNAITIGSGNEDLTNATIHYNFVPDDVASFEMLSTMAVDYSSDNVFTATANNAIIGNEYVLLVLKQSEGEIDLSAENLCYIDQKTATETAVSFEFIPKSDDFIMVVIVGDFGNGNKMVVANEWKTEYAVTWIVDGTESVVLIKEGTQITAPDVSGKEGYAFVGWTPSVPEIMPSENLTFTAMFEANSYDAVFDANGGAWSDGATEKTISVKFDDVITAPEVPEKQGYIFSKWTPEIGVMDSTDGKKFAAEWIYATDTRYTVETYTMNTEGEYEKSSQVFSGTTDSTVSVEAEEKTGFTFNSGNSVTEGTIKADNSLVLKVYYDRNKYAFTTVTDGVSSTENYYYGATIKAPISPEKQGYKFIKWEGEIPETMPANDLTFTAVFELSFDMNIRMPSTNIIKYGDSITLHTDLNGELPSGWGIEWSADNGCFDYSVSADGKTCIITPSKSGQTTFTAKVKLGNRLISSDTQIMTSKAGFFDKLIAFFKKIFGLLKNYEQAIGVMFY